MKTKFGIQLLHGNYEPSLDFLEQQTTWQDVTSSICRIHKFFCDVSIPLHTSYSFTSSKVTPDWRGLHPVYLSTLQNSVYRVIRVLSRGQNYHFRTIVMEEPYKDIAPSSNWWRSCMWRPFLLKLFSWFLRHTEKQHGISLRFVVGIVMVWSTYNVALNLLCGQ